MRTYWTTRKETDGWHIVSTIYEPTSVGRVGSGIFCCKAHRTRAAARRAIKRKEFY